MASIRQQRIASLLKRELGSVFQMERLTLFGGLYISITQTRPSPDMSTCKVYVSIMENVEKEQVVKELNGRARYVRMKLSERIGKQMRKLPELSFFLDDSLDYSERIDELLK